MRNLKTVFHSEGDHLMSSLFATKPLDVLMTEAAEEGDHRLRRALGPVNLVTLGVGAIIGAGIFVFTGTARSEERRVGKECRSGWWEYHIKKKRQREENDDKRHS